MSYQRKRQLVLMSFRVISIRKFHAAQLSSGVPKVPRLRSSFTQQPQSRAAISSQFPGSFIDLAIIPHFQCVETQTRAMTLFSVVVAVLSLVVATVHVVPGSAQSTVIGQFTGSSLTWEDGSPNPCLQSGATDEVGPTDCRNTLASKRSPKPHLANLSLRFLLH